MSTPLDLINGIGALLNASGVGVWQTMGAFQATDTAIVVEAMPPTPDRTVVLTVFPMTEIPNSNAARWLLQVVTRGLPNQALDALTLTDAVKAQLDGLRNITWGATGVSQCTFYSAVPMGQDDTVRFMHVLKFWLDLDEAGTTLRPAGGWD